MISDFLILCARKSEIISDLLFRAHRVNAVEQEV